jgi:hypothetical protein
MLLPVWVQNSLRSTVENRKGVRFEVFTRGDYEESSLLGCGTV